MEILRKKKGFTLIELIVVMAVLAVLVLLAAPKFVGQTKEAQFTKHINNAKVLEDASERYYIDHGKWPRGADEDVYTAEEVEAYAERIYDITGSELALEDGNYWDIDYAALGKYAKLPDKSERANYVLRNPVGKVYYLEGLTEAGVGRLPADVGGGDEAAEEPNEPAIPSHYVLATDADFAKDTDGNWRYTGTDEYVIIPHEIGGAVVTSYRYMFSGLNSYGVTSSPVKGVASTNPNVTNMSYMFFGNQATVLELSHFDTSNVITMDSMFYHTQAAALDLTHFSTSKVTDMNRMFANSYMIELDLSNFDTSMVTDMSSMFAHSRATILDLTRFNTSKVTDMSAMFSNSQATELYLTSFNTSKVTKMNSMFRNSKASILNLSSFTTLTGSNTSDMFGLAAATAGYARTQTDANRFNNSTTYKPSTLTFTVKP